MSFFAKKGTKYIVSSQCSAGRDIYVEIELSQNKNENIEIYRLKSIQKTNGDNIRSEEVLKFAKLGLDRANKKIKKPCFIKSIGYIPNDTKDYAMYENIVYDIIEYLHSGKEFKMINE